MKYRIAATVFAVCLSVPLIGCVPPQVEVELPPHEISYQGKYLKGDEGRARILELKNIDMTVYPHLRLRDGFTLQRATWRRQGGDQQGYVVAIYQASNKGFAIERLNSAQGTFLFGPIESPDHALEYVEFMVHEPPLSDYDREHVYIYSLTEFKEALSELNSAFQVINTPPTNVTRATKQEDGTYLVELVFKCELYVQRLVYLACLVHTDGSLEPLDSYIFIEGGPGNML